MGSLFHYTNVSAVYSILKQKKLRLTDIAYLNDSQELHDGIDNMEEAISLLPPYQPRVYVNDPHHDGAGSRARAQGDFNRSEMLNASAVDRMKDLVKKMRAGPGVEGMYVLSFTAAYDLLSQWKAYGLYAIEFDRDKLSRCLELADCIYDKAGKQSRAAELAHKFRYVAASIGFPPAVESDIKIACALFKHSGFSEESEVRSIVTSSDEVEFRVKGSLLVPFITKQIPIDSIKAIHIGPMPDQENSAHSMRRYLDSISSKSEEGSPHQIDVVKSDIPYRA